MQAEREQRTSRSHRNVLDAAGAIGDRRGRDLPAEIALPQQLAVGGIERVKESLAAAREENVAGGREQATVGDVRGRILPDLLPGQRIQRADSAIARFLVPNVDSLAAS